MAGETALSDYHPALIATDTANMQAGAVESFIDSAGMLGKSAMMSGIASIYNTGANLLGVDKFDVGAWLEENDQHTGAYYAANKGLADTAGFMATSLIPGGLAVKGLQLAKAGTMLGPFGRALGYASSTQQAYVKQGLLELAAEGGTVFNGISKSKLAAMAWGTADQMLNVAAFETAVAMTMKQSPLLEKDEWTDAAKHIALTSFVFGGAIGALESIALNSIFKGATKSIDATLRNYDTLRYAQGDLVNGDKAYGLAASILDLPTVGKNIEYTYKLAGKENKLELPIKDVLERTLTTTEKRGWDDFRVTINSMARGDTELGQQYSDYLINIVAKGKEAGQTKEEILDSLRDHLLNVGMISRVTSDASKQREVFYLAKELPKEKIGKINSFEELLSALRSRAPTGNDVSKNPYEFIGNAKDLNIGLVGMRTEAPEEIMRFGRFATIEDAFASGKDAVVLANGTIRINPKSKLFRHTEDSATTPRSFFNTKTGAFTDVAFPTVADISSTAKPLAMTAVDHLVGGAKDWTFKPFDPFPVADLDSLNASARYIYAKELKVVPPKIADTDLPMLDRIYQDGAAKWKDVVLKGADGAEVKVGDIPDFGAWLNVQKMTILRTTFEDSEVGMDVVDLATRMNVQAQWIETSIVNDFKATNRNDALSFSVPLRDSVKPQNLEIRWDFSKAKEVAAVGGTEATKKKLGENVLQQTFPDGASNVIYGHIGWQYRVKLANQGLLDAFAAVMGENAQRFMDLNPETATKIADQLGSGAGLLKFSNADYGDTLRLWAQYSGQLVNILGKEGANTTLTRLQPLMREIASIPEAGGELGILVTALRRTAEKFVINPDNAKQLVNVEALGKDGKVIAAVMDDLAAQGRRTKFDIESDLVAHFMSESTVANAERIEKMKVLMTARGFNYNYDPRVVYAPPVDTARYPFFAFVRKKPEMMGGSSEVSMVTARTEGELRALTAKIPEEYEAVFKQDVEKFHKIKGDYDYALTLKEPTIDATLQKRGILGDFFPETRPENVIDDFINWHQRQEVSLVRRSVETRYAQTFEELRAIGKQYEQVGSSKFGGVLKKFRSQIENPFEDYLKTALDISKRSEYTLIHEANEFAEALGKSAYRFFGTNREKAMEGSITWQEANKLSEKYGIGGPYGKGPYSDVETYFKANAPEDRNIVREFVSKANMTLVNITLRLDWANSLVNVISTPILLGTEMASIKSLVANDSVLAGKLSELRSIGVPGSQDIRVPSTMGLLAKSIGNFWSSDKAALLARYKELGAVKDMLSQYHEMIEHFAYKPYKKASELLERGNKGIEIGAKITGNEFAEQFTRFVSADVMRQLTDPIVAAGKLSLAEQNAYISVFVNRVQGNYLSSQRPILFQGVLGSAVSLFQTYQFNLLQQLFRHVENRDTRALATLGGLQAGIYGMNGIPFFEAVNTHLIGNSNLNPEHKDVYSTVPQIAGNQLGDWMMYGTASAFPLWSSKAPSLYTRGDINPRHISIIPITPMDVPAVDGSIRFISNLWGVGKQLVQGADISSTLLEGLEHNSLSRPLAGIAQVAQGYTTTSKGSLISASNDFSVIATASRILGAKPLDESLALNSLFRLNAYQAADQERIQELGEVVKTKLRAGKLPHPEELHKFQLEYAKAGGRIENYVKTLQRWNKDANVSVVNQLAQQHRSTYSKRLQEIMGGTTIQDFRNRAIPATTSSEVPAGEETGALPQTEAAAPVALPQE